MERIVLGPRRQHRGDAVAQRLGVAAVEIEQVRPLQGERIARMGAQDVAPGRARAEPVAGGDAAQRDEVAELALARALRERAGDVELGDCFGAKPGSVRPSRKPAFIRRGSSHAGSAAIASSRSAIGVP